MNATREWRWTRTGPHTHRVSLWLHKECPACAGCGRLCQTMSYIFIPMSLTHKVKRLAEAGVIPSIVCPRCGGTGRVSQEAI